MSLRMHKNLGNCFVLGEKGKNFWYILRCGILNGYCTKSALKSTVRNRPFREMSNAALCYISVALDTNIYSEKSL